MVVVDVVIVVDVVVVVLALNNWAQKRRRLKLSPINVARCMKRAVVGL